MENLVQVDRQTPFLMPQDLKDWLPENHIVHFIIDAVEAVSANVSFHLNKRGSGSKQFNPEMMMELVIYSYCTKRFSSYTIEKATYTDIPTMLGQTHYKMISCNIWLPVVIHRSKTCNNALDVFWGIETIIMPLSRQPQKKSFCPVSHSLAPTFMKIFFIMRLPC